MTVMDSGISWTDGTLNLWVGCRKVSRACENCYAEFTVNKLFRNQFDRPFEEFAPKLHRLKDIRKFKPKPDTTGVIRPKMVFLNSLSDMWWEDVPDEHRITLFDEIEQHPDIVFQILTKRFGPAKKWLIDRYGQGRGIPRHIWIGPTVEDNRVKKGLDIFRSVKEAVGDMTLMVSTEPITAPTDELDYEGFDWVITGGESGPRAAKMERKWLEDALNNACKHAIPIWHKQHGTPASHPNLDRAPDGLSNKAKVEWLVQHGLELYPKEKGGATIDGRVFRLWADHLQQLTDQLNREPAFI